MTKLGKSRSKARLTDFKMPDLIEALQIVRRLPENEPADAASSVMTGLEGLLTSVVSDESEWSTAWTKLLMFIMRAKKLPDTFGAAGIEVPKRFAYMLRAPLTDGFCRSDSDVKAEEPAADSLSPSAAHAAKQVGGEGPLPGLPGRIYISRAVSHANV